MRTWYIYSTRWRYSSVPRIEGYVQVKYIFPCWDDQGDRTRSHTTSIWHTCLSLQAGVPTLKEGSQSIRSWRKGKRPAQHCHRDCSCRHCDPVSTTVLSCRDSVSVLSVFFGICLLEEFGHVWVRLSVIVLFCSAGWEWHEWTKRWEILRDSLAWLVSFKSAILCYWQQARKPLRDLLTYMMKFTSTQIHVWV